jgi:hypothetical protein
MAATATLEFHGEESKKGGSSTSSSTRMSEASRKPNKMAGSMSELRRRFEKLERSLGSLIISIILFFVFLLIADFSAGFFFNLSKQEERVFSTRAYMQPLPFVAFGGSRDPELQIRYGLNRLGYRGPVPQLPKPTSEFRVVVIGGSTVILGNPSISELIQRLSEENGLSGVRAYNFGVAASTLRMDIARLVFEVGEYRPDLIIFYGGGNDIGMPFQGDPRPGYPPNFIAYEHNPLLLAGTEEQSFATLLKLALFHSKIINELAGDMLRESLVPLQATRDNVGWNGSDWSKIVADTYLRDVGKANEISSMFGARAVFIFQPILAYKRQKGERERSLIDPSFNQHASYCRSIIASRLSEMNRVQGIDSMDISSIFDSESRDVFYDGIHIEQEYFSVVAQAIFDSIKDRLPR